MTTINDELEERIARLGPVIIEQGLELDLSADPTGLFPQIQTWFNSSLNRLSYGADVSSLNLGGGFNQTDVGVGAPIASMRTRNRAITTGSGHSLELDDTPGNERIILRHNTGNGIEVKSDGSMIIAAGKQIISVTEDQKIIIEGNATIVYGGNVDMQVAGDFNLSVAGDYNLSVGENRNENVEGAYRTTTEGNVGHIVKGSLSNTVLKTSTTTVLEDNNTVIKGKARYTSQGDMQIASGATTRLSAKTNMFQSAANMNVAASDLSVFGASGTFGGENIVMYGKGATFGEGVTAPTFHGDLDGTAGLAVQADITNSQNYGEALTGSTSGYSVTNTATPTTSQPNSSVLSNYLNNTPYGTVTVSVDIGDHFLRALNRSDATSGLSSRDLSTSEIRALLRTEGVRNDPTFIGNAVASGALSPSYSQTNPPNVVRVSGRSPEPYRGNNPAGRRAPGSDTRFLVPDDLTENGFTPYIPITSSTVITRTTPIAEGVYLSRYLGGTGQQGRLSQISIARRQQIARNLQPNAEIFRRIRSNRDADFSNHRLVVAEGLYQPTDAEQAFAGWATSINKLRSEGRAAVYELHNSNGLIDAAKTFDLAVYLKTVTVFEKLILDYDTYDVDGSLNAQIIIVMPELSLTYEVSDGGFTKDVETRYNGSIMSSTDLLEITS
jgi:hypothetical protein